MANALRWTTSPGTFILLLIQSLFNSSKLHVLISPSMYLIYDCVKTIFKRKNTHCQCLKKPHFFKGAELLYNVIFKSYPKKQKLKFLKTSISAIQAVFPFNRLISNCIIVLRFFVISVPSLLMNGKRTLQRTLLKLSESVKPRWLYDQRSMESSCRPMLIWETSLRPLTMSSPSALKRRLLLKSHLRRN